MSQSMRIHRDSTHDFFKTGVIWERRGNVYMASAQEGEVYFMQKVAVQFKGSELFCFLLLKSVHFRIFIVLQAIKLSYRMLYIGQIGYGLCFQSNLKLRLVTFENQASCCMRFFRKHLSCTLPFLFFALACALFLLLTLSLLSPVCTTDSRQNGCWESCSRVSWSVSARLKLAVSFACNSACQVA